MKAQPSESKHMAASDTSSSSRMDEGCEPSMVEAIDMSLDSTLIEDMSLEEEEIDMVDMSQGAHLMMVPHVEVLEREDEIEEVEKSSSKYTLSTLAILPITSRCYDLGGHHNRKARKKVFKEVVVYLLLSNTLSTYTNWLTQGHSLSIPRALNEWRVSIVKAPLPQGTTLEYYQIQVTFNDLQVWEDSLQRADERT